MQLVETSRRQVLLMEYEILDSLWTHLHQRIWMSALVLIALSMLGITFLPVSLTPENPLRTEIVTFVAVIAVLLTALWWVLVRRMLGYQRVVEHRKKEIERQLGMRTELYMAFARNGKRGQRARALVQEEAADDPELRADLADFLRTAGLGPVLIPGENWAWNLLPILFIGAWTAFWLIVA